MGITSVCQVFQTLTLSQTNCCSSKILDGLPSAVTRPDHFQSILETILFNDDVCRHNAVVLVNHPGVSALPRLHVFRLNFQIAQSLSPEAVGPTCAPCSQDHISRVFHPIPIHSVQHFGPPNQGPRGHRFPSLWCSNDQDATKRRDLEQPRQQVCRLGHAGSI